MKRATSGTRPEKGKRLRDVRGKMHPVTRILRCVQTGKKTCSCLVHRRGWVDFSSRSCKKMPPHKFRHSRSKDIRRP